jgi:hypothetical protein
MPQERPPVDHWEMQRGTVDIIPLRVETYNSATAVWTETTSYQVQCVRYGSLPASASWGAASTVGPDTGFVVNGPVLDPSQIGGDFLGFYKLSASPLFPVEPAFTLKLT